MGKSFSTGNLLQLVSLHQTHRKFSKQLHTSQYISSTENCWSWWGTRDCFGFQQLDLRFLGLAAESQVNCCLFFPSCSSQTESTRQHQLRFIVRFIVVAVPSKPGGPTVLCNQHLNGGTPFTQVRNYSIVWSDNLCILWLQKPEGT